MKNIKILSALLLVGTIWSCDPLEDEIKELNDNFAYSQDIEYTLESDDYDISDEECSCSGFGNFGSEEDAKLYIPAILTEKFPALEKGSSAKITYDIFNGSSPDLRGTYTEVTVPDGDYDLLNGFDGFDNFGNPDADVIEWVIWKGYEGEDGDYIDVTFDYFAGGFFGGAVSRIVYTVAYGWQYAWPLPDEAYEAFGESRSCFGVYDFSYDDEAFDVLHLYLNEFKTFLHEAGDILIVEFNYDNDDDCNDDIADGPLVDPTEQDVAMYIFNGTEWIAYGDAYQVTSNTISFGHNGTNWVADNTIKYSLTNDDYVGIGTAFETSNPNGASSASNFKNFDISLWSSDQIFEAITGRLLDAPGIIKEDGQKYLVNYATWEPGAGSGSIHVIYSAADSAFIAVTE